MYNVTFWSEYDYSFDGSFYMRSRNFLKFRGNILT